MLPYPPSELPSTSYPPPPEATPRVTAPLGKPLRDFAAVAVRSMGRNGYPPPRQGGGLATLSPPCRTTLPLLHPTFVACYVTLSLPEFALRALHARARPPPLELGPALEV